MTSIVSEVQALLGKNAVIAAGPDLLEYGADRAAGDWSIRPSAIVFPGSIAEVQAVVACCAARGVAIVPSGGRTGLAGGACATQGEVVCSLARMRRVLDVNASARLLRCEAGASLEQVQQAASRAGLLYPIDFASKGSAQIGGSIATNAGGVKVLRYGLTRRWVQGLCVVTANGALLDLGGELIKDNAGLDLRQLFIGSEGTLGIIVEATLRLCAQPRALAVALCCAKDLRGVVDCFVRLREAEPRLCAFEIFDESAAQSVLAHSKRSDFPFSAPGPWQVLVEIEGDSELAAREAIAATLETSLAQGEVVEVAVAASAAQAGTLWALREGISESLHARRPFKADISLPIGEIHDFLPRWCEAVARMLPGVEAVCFGHLGDGNLHLNHLCPKEGSPEDFLAQCHRFEAELFGLVRDHRGSISAEHGIGILKRAYLSYTRSEDEIALMRQIKQALDPTGLFNPGKVLPG